MRREFGESPLGLNVSAAQRKDLFHFPDSSLQLQFKTIWYFQHEECLTEEFKQVDRYLILSDLSGQFGVSSAESEFKGEIKVPTWSCHCN